MKSILNKFLKSFIDDSGKSETRKWEAEYLKSSEEGKKKLREKYPERKGFYDLLD